MKTLLLQNKQFLFYCVIGASGVALDFGIYTALVKNNLLVYQAANAAGYGSGTLFSFIFNARFNFCVKDKIALRLASFFGIAFLGWIASAALLNLLIGRYGLDKYHSKLAALVVIVFLQYNLNRLLSFRRVN